MSSEQLVPLWAVGARRPPDLERRKNPGALDRHKQAQSGMLPADQLDRRAPRKVEPAPQLVPLWSS